MTVSVTARNPRGEVRVIPSKSAAHRYLISAALSEGTTEIVCPAKSKDIEATARALSALGTRIEEKDGSYFVTPRKSGGAAELNCGESGSTLRFLIPLCASLGREITLTGEGRLPARPISPLLETLSENGAEFKYDGVLPLTTKGGLHSGVFKIKGDISSQFISGLIFALPLLSGDSVIEITGDIESRGYIDLTLSVVSEFGIRFEASENRIYIKGNQKYITPGKIEVPGDWSNAAFWACLGAFSDEGITCRGLSHESLQGDRKILDILEGFGATVERKEDGFTVKRGSLSGRGIDASDIPDLVPVLSVVAALSGGETTVYNAKRLRLKESDRIKSTADMIRALGGECYEADDGLSIIGKKALSGGIVDSVNDHRIAMSASVAAASGCEVVIKGAEAVEKSYGDFFLKYESLGAEVKVLEEE